MARIFLQDGGKILSPNAVLHLILKPLMNNKSFCYSLI